jgi:hypothetical protein
MAEGTTHRCDNQTRHPHEGGAATKFAILILEATTRAVSGAETLIVALLGFVGVRLAGLAHARALVPVTPVQGGVRPERGKTTVPRMALVVALAVPLSFTSSVHAATFAVNSTLDVPDAIRGNGICETASRNAVCTLRAAIEESNSLLDEDRIEVPAGTYPLTASAGGGLVITDTVAIDGAGSDSTVIDGGLGLQGNFTVLQIGDLAGMTTPDVYLSRLAIRNADANSGTIRVQPGASLSVQRSALSENKSFSGGGAILNLGDTVVAESAISDNDGGPRGGGIASGPFASLRVVKSTISGNHATQGGGILNNGSLTLWQSTVSGNSSRRGGGGILQAGGTASIVEATITDNLANAALGFQSDSIGGGIKVVFGGIISMRNTILAGNNDNWGPPRGTRLLRDACLAPQQSPRQRHRLRARRSRGGRNSLRPGGDEQRARRSAARTASG